MKKLLFSLVAAAACGAVTADNVPATATFENYGDKQFSVLLMDDGTELVNDGGYWTSLITEDSSSEFTLTAYGSGKYLQINTGNLPLWRTFSSVGKTTAVTGNPPSGIDADGVVVSSDVKLTACTEFPDLTKDFVNEKLALFLFVPEEGDTTAPDEGLYVVGGAMVGNPAVLTPTAYRLDVNVDSITNADGWATVAIKTYGNIYTGEDTEKLQGFVIAVGKPNSTLSAAAVVEADYAPGFVKSDLTTAASTRIDNRTLIPATKVSDGTIAGLGFQGEGGIDNVNLFADDFATDADAMTVKISEGVTYTGIKLGDNDAYSFTSTGAVTITLTGVANKAVTADYGEGRTATVAYGQSDVTVTFTPVKDATLTITVEDAKFKVGETPYADFAIALAAALAADGKVTLLGTVELSAQVKISGTVKLDLNGQTITGADKRGALIEVQSGAELTIIDTFGGGKIAPTAGDAIKNLGVLTINAGTYDAGIVGTGAVTINGGKFKVKVDAATIPGDKQWSDLTEGYYTLKDKGGDAPTVGAGEGSVEVDSTTGDAEIKPADGKTEVTVTIPNGFTGNIIVPSTVTTVKGGVPAEKLGVKIGEYTVIGAFKINETSYAIELDKDATVKVGNEDIQVEPELATVAADGETAVDPFVAGDKPAATVKTIPGLKYSLIWDADVGGSFGNVAVEPTQAKSSRMTLEDETDKTNVTKRFYKVKVTK